MKDYSYFFEQLDLITLFASAFDDAFVYRYDAATREARERIDVRYINGPKHRVLHDLTDKAKTLALPVVTIEQTSISRDKSRVFNKDGHFYRSGGINNKVAKIPTPIPVNLELNVSIIAYFKEDMDQIIQNIITNCDPYIIVSWKIPEAFGMTFIDEIRSEIQGSGVFTYENPKNLSSDVKWRISADTTFTVKGWLFKSLDQRQEPIYTVRTDFKTINSTNILESDSYPVLSGYQIDTDVILISAFPEFTNLFYSVSGKTVPVYENTDIKSENDNTFIVYGKRFSYNNVWYLSSGITDFYVDYGEVTTAKYPLVSAFKIPSDLVNVVGDNVAIISIPRNTLSASGSFTLMTSNSAGWVSYDDLVITNLVDGG